MTVQSKLHVYETDAVDHVSLIRTAVPFSILYRGTMKDIVYLLRIQNVLTVLQQ